MIKILWQLRFLIPTFLLLLQHGDSNSFADVYGSGSENPTQAKNLDSPFTGSPISVCAYNWHNVPTNGVVARWSLDDAAIDSSGGNNNGTLLNGPIWVTGRFGKALQFDGVNDYVQVLDAPSLNFGTGSFSYGLWMKATPGTEGVPFDKGGGCLPCVGYDLEVSGSGYAVAYISDGTTIRGLWGAVVNDGTWHHVFAVIDRSAQAGRIYVDGVLRNTYDISDIGSLTNDYPLRIGWHYFNGLIDEVLIYNRALSGNEITDLYNYSGQSLDPNTWRQTFVSWLNTPQLGYSGMSNISFADGGPECSNGNLYLSFHSDSYMDSITPGGADGAWPTNPQPLTPLTWGSVLRSDGLYHLVKAGIALKASSWMIKTDVERQFELFHEVGHALAVNHEGPVMSPVAFGIAPFTRYDTCENHNCLASIYDTADYDDWYYELATNTGSWRGIVNSNTAWTDRQMIGAYYGNRAAHPIYSCLGNPSPGILRTTAVDASRLEDSYFAELYKWDGVNWVYYAGQSLSASTSPEFGGRLTVDFNVGSDTGYFLVGFRGYKTATGYNYVEPVDWSYYIAVTGYTNNDLHPPCGIMPRRAGSNVSYLNWVASTQNYQYVVVKFRALTGYNSLNGPPYPTFTFVTNVYSPTTEGWHWFTPLGTIPPNTARFAYQLTTVGASGQSLDSEWVLVEPNDLGNP